MYICMHIRMITNVNIYIKMWCVYREYNTHTRKHMHIHVYEPLEVMWYKTAILQPRHVVWGLTSFSNAASVFFADSHRCNTVVLTLWFQYWFCYS